jgi:hypothetical protein
MASMKRNLLSRQVNKSKQIRPPHGTACFV